MRARRHRPDLLSAACRAVSGAVVFPVTHNLALSAGGLAAPVTHPQLTRKIDGYPLTAGPLDAGRGDTVR